MIVVISWVIIIVIKIVAIHLQQLAFLKRVLSVDITTKIFPLVQLTIVNSDDCIQASIARNHGHVIGIHFPLGIKARQ